MSTSGEDGANLTKVIVSFKLNGFACHARNNAKRGPQL